MEAKPLRHSHPRSVKAIVRSPATMTSGVISGYVTLLDPVLAGAGFIEFARVRLNGQDEDAVSRFVGKVARFPEVLECSCRGLRLHA